MELEIKLYADKPSRIGVLYDTSWLAVRPLEEFITRFPGHTFMAFFELNEDKINLTLQSDSTGGKEIYKHLRYKPEIPNKIIGLMNQGLPLEFVHLYRKTNVSYMAKAFSKNRTVPISKVELIHPEYLVG